MLDERDERRREQTRSLERRGLVGDAHLERAEPRLRPDVPPDPGVVGEHAEPGETLDPGLPGAVGAEPRRRAGAGQLGEDRRPHGEHPGVLAVDERRVRGECENDGQPRQHRLEPLVALLGARDADMHVQAVDALPARRVADAPDHLEVALLLHDRQRLQVRARVSAGGRDDEPVRPRAPAGGGAQLAERSDGLADVGADARVELDHRGVHLGLQRPRQPVGGRVAQEHLDRSDRLQRSGVEDHQLLLDPDRERRRAAEVRLDHLRMPCTGRPAASHA